MSDLMTAQQAADYLRLHIGHLANLRSRGEGPRYIKLGSAVRYRAADLDAWVGANLVETSR